MARILLKLKNIYKINLDQLQATGLSFITEFYYFYFDKIIITEFIPAKFEVTDEN